MSEPRTVVCDSGPLIALAATDPTEKPVKRLLGRPIGTGMGRAPREPWSMVMPDEKRRFARIPFDARARLAGSAGEWDVQLVDVCLKGALVAVPEDWPGRVGDSLRLEVHLGGDAGTIQMEATVAHAEDQRAGLHARHMDLDSLTHLRRLVELNLGDPERLSRELSALG
jgi:hypothetical protein